MPQKSLISELSRRERQIMDIVYKRGAVCAINIISELPGKPSYSTVRKLMSILETKGYLYHERERNNRYLYHPVIPAAEARASALAHLLDTFFKGSAGRAAIALLKKSEADISEEEKRKIISLIKESERKGR